MAGTLSGLQRSGDGVVLASRLKRAIIRKDPTFSEAEYGFRAFGELLAHLASSGAIELTEGPARGDPEVSFPEAGGHEEAGFDLLQRAVSDAKATHVLGEALCAWHRERVGRRVRVRDF